MIECSLYVARCAGSSESWRSESTGVHICVRISASTSLRSHRRSHLRRRAASRLGAAKQQKVLKVARRRRRHGRCSRRRNLRGCCRTGGRRGVGRSRVTARLGQAIGRSPSGPPGEDFTTLWTRPWDTALGHCLWTLPLGTAALPFVLRCKDTVFGHCLWTLPHCLVCCDVRTLPLDTALGHCLGTLPWDTAFRHCRIAFCVAL